MTNGQKLKQKLNYLRKQKLGMYTKKERTERASLTDRVIAVGSEKTGMNYYSYLVLKKG